MENLENMSNIDLKSLVKQLFAKVRKLESINSSKLSVYEHKQLDITEDMLVSFFNEINLRKDIEQTLKETQAIPRW